MLDYRGCLVLGSLDLEMATPLVAQIERNEVHLRRAALLAANFDAAVSHLDSAMYELVSRYLRSCLDVAPSQSRAISQERSWYKAIQQVMRGTTLGST